MDRIYWRTFATAFFASSMLALFLIQPVLGYTLQRNNYPNSPVGCTNVAPYWCIEWPLAGNGLSSTTYAYLKSALNTHPAGETVDMKQQARNAFARWNAVPAKEPFLTEVSSILDSSGNHTPYWCPTFIDRAAIYPTDILAFTSDYTSYDVIGSGSKNTIICSQMYVSSLWAFDTDQDPNDGLVDARWMFGHEQGHMLCLGHTGHVAIMYPTWPNSQYMGYTPTSDDILGLQVAYGAS